MDSPQPPAAPTSSAAPTRTNRFMRIFYGVVAVITAGIGLLRLVDTFTLPSCTSDTTRKTIVGIAKERNVVVANLTDIRKREGDGSDVECSATMALEDGQRYAIDYRAFWDGLSAKIKINKVEPI